MAKNVFERIKSVAVYCASREAGDDYAPAVVEFARYLAANGVRLVYGGSNVGMMKLLADTVLAAGGEAVGVITEAFARTLSRDDLTELVVVKDLAERKREMLLRADAAIALPGGVGTWDELFDALALRRVKSGGHKKPIGLLNVNGFYDTLLQFIDEAKRAGFSPRGGRELLAVASTPAELFKKLAGNLPPVVNKNTSPSGSTDRSVKDCIE